MIIVQEEISVSEDFIKEVIAHYEKVSDSFKICCCGGFVGGKKEIIEEIKKLSKVGKTILLIEYQYKEHMKELKKVKQ